jgi:hypothetical protein
MLDPFVSYKEEIIEHLNQFDPMCDPENEESRDMKNPGSREKKSYE